MSKIDTQFGAFIKESLKSQGYKNYQIAAKITGKSGKPITPVYFCQLLNGNNWYLDYVQQALRALGLSVFIDGTGFYVQTKEQINMVKFAEEINKTFTKFSIPQTESSENDGTKKKKMGGKK